MAVAIRLMRFGKKQYPTYRIVALDRRAKRGGAYIEKIGIYQPMSSPEVLEWQQERLDYWLRIGAIVSDGVRKLMVNKMKKEVSVPAVKTEKPASATKTAPAARAPKVKKTPSKKSAR